MKLAYSLFLVAMLFQASQAFITFSTSEDNGDNESEGNQGNQEPAASNIEASASAGIDASGGVSKTFNISPGGFMKAVQGPGGALTFKFDIPGLKIQAPALRLPGVQLKAKIKQPTHGVFFRLLSMGLPRITFNADVSGGID